MLVVVVVMVVVVVVVVFGDYRVSPKFLLCGVWVLVEVGLGCDKNIILRYT